MPQIIEGEGEEGKRIIMFAAPFILGMAVGIVLGNPRSRNYVFWHIQTFWDSLPWNRLHS